MFIFHGTWCLGHSGFVFGVLQEKDSDTVGKKKGGGKSKLSPKSALIQN